MKFRISTFIVVCVALFTFTGCYEDKGNYTYGEIEEVTVTFPENIAAMEGSEYLEFDPEIVSSINGPISGDNKHYSFGCKLNWQRRAGSSQRWTDINPDKTKAVKYFAEMPANNYTFWYTVKNEDTGVTFNFKGYCTVISTTSEGWMVLSNDGADKKVRMDFVFTDSKGVEHVRQNLFDGSGPQLYNALGITMQPTQMSYGDRIVMMTGSGAYELNTASLQYTESRTVKSIDFVDQGAPGEIIQWEPIQSPASYGPLSKCAVTDQGNAYSVTSYYAGAGFEFPMNTDKPGNDPTYKVAPFIGCGQNRPGNSYGALFYDETNKRFMGWFYYASGDQKKLLYPLRDPENAKFSFQTGMDIVDMENTAFNNEVWSVLQDASGKRHLYGIYVAGYTSEYVQDNVYECDAPDFHEADDYAFHSMNSLMLYSKNNKVYCYNIYTGQLLDEITLDSSEKITKIKFPLCKSPSPTGLNNWDKLKEDQNRLIVASTTGQENGGIVRFYDIDYLSTGKMTLNREYKGFGQEIVDVTYRERRK